MIEKIKAWCRNSLTIAWARFLAIAGTVLELASYAADFLNSIGFNAYVPPKYLGLYTLAVAALTELARRRSLSKG